MDLPAAGAAAGTVIHRLTFTNADRSGFSALSIGTDCFLGDDVLIDLAAPVELDAQVTLAARAMVLTHLNVGYHDHPLQARFPARAAKVTFRQGTFIGAGATVLAGVTVGPRAFIGACSLVNRDIGADEVAVGVPVRVLPPPDTHSV
jgi:acetyltransferase-like isoleucine patch superfamily enzyme